MKENHDHEQEDFFDISNLFQEENSDGVRVRVYKVISVFNFLHILVCRKCIFRKN